MTKKRSYRFVIIFSLLLVMFINTAAGVLAMSTDEIQNQIDSNQAQQSEIEDELADIREQISAQKEKDEQISQEMAAILEEKQVYASELEKMLDDLEYIYQQIEEFDQSIAETEERYEEALELFYNRARVMYQYTQFDSLRLFTESKDIFDFASRDRLFARMMENDRKTLEDLEIMRTDLENKKALQQQMKVDAEALVAEKEAVIAAIENEEAVALDKLQASRSALEALESQEEAMRRESDRIEAEIRELQALYEQYTTNYDGRLMWPSRNTRKISSYFGMRIHPIYGYPKMHNGIDIGASYGTDILASADGVVTSVTYNEGGYGWYIVVYHGDGISTLYAHCSSIIASVGETVKQGQVIALVGSTGASTGPHIHFEVRENGTPVDPLGYVSP